MSKEFHWAVLGPGNIARRFAEALRGAPGAVLYAVGSRDLGRAQAFAAEFGAERAYGSYQELIEDDAVDAFYIATPHVHHCENAVACLERGKAVLVEKPITINAASARRMARAAREHRAFLMEAMWSRFLPAAFRVREMLAQGVIGTPRMLTADFSFSSEPDKESRLFSWAMAGGGLLDVGVYALSLSSMVFGPTPLQADGYCHIGPTGVDEHAAMVLQHAGGAVSALTCGVRAAGSGEARIVGDAGRIELAPFWRAESVRLVRLDGSVTVEQYPFEVNGFEYEIREVMDCVRRGLTESSLLPLGESIAVVETMDAMRARWGLVFPPDRAESDPA